MYVCFGFGFCYLGLFFFFPCVCLFSLLCSLKTVFPCVPPPGLGWWLFVSIYDRFHLPKGDEVWTVECTPPHAHCRWGAAPTPACCLWQWGYLGLKLVFQLLHSGYSECSERCLRSTFGDEVLAQSFSGLCRYQYQFVDSKYPSPTSILYLQALLPNCCGSFLAGFSSSPSLSLKIPSNALIFFFFVLPLTVLLEVCWRKFVREGPRVPMINTDRVPRVHMFRGSKMQF